MTLAKTTRIPSVQRYSQSMLERGVARTSQQQMAMDFLIQPITFAIAPGHSLTFAGPHPTLNAPFHAPACCRWSMFQIDVL